MTENLGIIFTTVLKGIAMKTLNLVIETRYTEELYELHQQFINKIEKQLTEQKDQILQSDDRNDYKMISNLLKP
ncbi:43095_t:CDS:2 [Gigaspora margarita]|uniref:43095_t:CDS:1 n=1 Tax=Gigaspora margarita TaxID=4874 RepID=A0ABM8W1B5_GIGMA|nr:43095_t:CDS:2 [Gigaspora margarita]